MMLVIFKIIGSVAINDIFSFKWGHYVPEGGILDYWGIIIFWFIILLYPFKR